MAGYDKNREELDDFWAIDKLIPPKKENKRYENYASDTDAVEVILTAKESTAYDKLHTIEMRPSDAENAKLTFPPASKEDTPEADEEYSPESPFISKVRIFRQKNFFYYSAFYDEGIKYLSETCDEISEPPFFSYVPQYSQLDSEQKKWYFYMRSCLRKREWIKTSYSYLLLYIFELLNVEQDKPTALSMLCLIWVNYRKKYPKLDPLMPEWITDFCLVNKLTPEPSLFGESYHVLLERASFKELFICRDRNDNSLVPALLELSSNYDYKKSKFAVGDNLPLFDTHIPGALRAVIRSLDEKKSIFAFSGELKRMAFPGALCTPQSKCRIDVEYCSLSRSHEMRFLITDAVKHTENKIRAYIGVKSRLTVYSLPADVRNIIDNYINDALPGRLKMQKEETHEYDALYELPKSSFSLSKARKIEQSSWDTTKRLVEAFGEDEETAKEAIIPHTPEKTPQNTNSFADRAPIYEAEASAESPEKALLCALSSYSCFVSAAVREDYEAQERFARERGKLIDSVADEINEIAAEVFGDIILEKKDGGYAVIEDYSEVFENA